VGGECEPAVARAFSLYDVVAGLHFLDGVFEYLARSQVVRDAHRLLPKCRDSGPLRRLVLLRTILERGNGLHAGGRGLVLEKSCGRRTFDYSVCWQLLNEAAFLICVEVEVKSVGPNDAQQESRKK
jgi:hypothetical protein